MARLLEYKYRLVSEGASMQEVLQGVKKEILNAYKLYVNPRTAKEPAFEMFARAGEPNSAEIMADMTNLVTNIDTLIAQPDALYELMNTLLANMTALDVSLKEPHKILQRLPKESTRNIANHDIRKLGTMLQRLSSIMSKQARIVQKFTAGDIPLLGGPTAPKRKPLTKEQLNIFRISPAAQRLGLDDIDVFQRMLSFPDIRERITTVVNAIKRGHIPIDGPEVAAEAGEIKRLLDQKAATNVPFFEAGEEQAQQATKQLTDPAEQWSHQMQERKKQLALEREEGEDEGEVADKYSSSFDEWMRR